MAGYAAPSAHVFDLRSFLRSGFRYALASNSITVTRFALAALVVWFTANRVSDTQQRWLAILIGIGGGLVVVLLGRWADGLRVWIDRRFFREAYDAEKILGELSNKVVAIRDRKQLVETVSREIDIALHPLSFTVLSEHDGSFTVTYTVGTGLREPATIAPSSGILRTLRSQRGPIKVDFEDPQSWVFGMSELDQYLLRALGTRVLIPVSVDSRLLGILSLGPKRSDALYSRADLRLLSATASQTGLALENARLMDAVRREAAQRERLIRELEIAREVQQRLFPQVLPQVEGLDFAGYCRPAQGVGGDYYDFIRLDDGSLGIAVGDVSGKGIAAALLMASLQASLRAQTIARCDTLAMMIQNVNRLVFEASSQNRYATFFYAQYDPNERKLRFVNAGHNAPILFRARRTDVSRLEQGGTVLGLFPQAAYTEGSISIAPGDLLVAFTDGISEAENPMQEEFGETRLLEAIKKANTRSAADLIASVLREVDAFTSGASQHDDMTLIAVRAF